MRRLINIVLFSLAGLPGITQSGPNLGDATPLPGNAATASRFSADYVNLFTGQPDISVPLFNYSSSNGIGVSVGLHYVGTGGLHLNEQPSATGLGWYLSTGGSITRIIRGLPDDVPQKGFLNTTAIPADYRTNADKYYYDSLDTQQDVFQFNFNGNSGKFYIKRNKQIILVPFSKLKITPDFDPDPNIAKIRSFTITTEDGVRYLFNDYESNTLSGAGMHAGYSSYYTAWNLSKIIAPFSTDTISFTYAGNTASSTYGYPAVYYLASPYTSISNAYIVDGNQTTTSKKIQSISLPNKETINFIYSKDFEYTTGDAALEKVTISDSIFRAGYFLNYQDSAGILFLKSVVPYTAKERKKGYQFFYDINTAHRFYLRSTTGVSTDVDDWGFDMGTSTSVSTTLGTNLYPSGVWQNRAPNLAATKKNILNRVVLPEGANIYYDYELNDKNGAVLTYNYFSVLSNSIATNTISLQNSYIHTHVLNFKIDTGLLRTQSPPLSGICNFVCKIKSTSNPNLVYDSIIFSLYDLYYNGLKAWSVNLPNANYTMETNFSGSGSVTSSFRVYISWFSHFNDGESDIIGGLRVKQITYKNDSADANPAYIKSYRYVLEDGSSSGMIGELPMSVYDYRLSYVNNTTFAYNFRFYYKAVTQQPMNVIDFAQGNPVGYSRVEVINGTIQKNLGKEVHTFTGIKEAGAKNAIPQFPFAPIDLNSWAMGLPLSIEIYDSSVNLRKKTSFQYDIATTTFNSTDDRNLKLGLSQKVNFEDASYNITATKNVYTAQEYYPVSGRVFRTFIYDTTYDDLGSPLTSQTELQYDTTNFLVKKIITSYDRNRNLNLEKRFYYPQDYTITGAIGKLRDSGIITPVIATEQWITGDATPRIIGGTITDFQQLANAAIKPYRTYALESNKPLPSATIGSFNPAVLNRNTTYFRLQAEYGVYDAENNLTQSTNKVTGISNAVITDYSNLYKTAEVSNALFSDVAYTSFESDGNGNWSVGSTTRDNTNAFSGKKSYTLANGSVIKSGLTSIKAYLVTLWAKSGASITLNGTSVGTSISNMNGWYLYSKSLTGVTQITVAGTGTIDELRLHPVDANMVTYAYEPNVGVISTVDANNTIVYSEYDNLNRVKVIRDRNKNVVQKYDYSDSVYTVSLLPSWSPLGFICGSNFQYQVRQKDINQYSLTYNNIQYVAPQTIDSCLCPPLNYKCINGVPELGTRRNKSTTRLNQTPPYQWQCVYYYTWSDCSVSPDYTEINSTACTTSSGCGTNGGGGPQ